MHLTIPERRIDIVDGNHERSTTMNITTTRNSGRKHAVHASRVLTLLLLIVGIVGAQAAGATPLIPSSNNGGSGGSSDTGTIDESYESVLRDSGYIVSEAPEPSDVARISDAERTALLNPDYELPVSRVLTVAEVLDGSGYFVPQPIELEIASGGELVTVPGSRVTAW